MATAAGGGWSADTSPALSEGTYTAQAEQLDEAGNRGISAANTFTVDSTGRATGRTAPSDGALAKDATPMAAAAGGGWSADTSPALSEGTYTAQAEQLDEAGNRGISAANTFTVD